MSFRLAVFVSLSLKSFSVDGFRHIQRSSQFGDDANFEQLMVSMLDERDKLVDSLKNEQVFELLINVGE